MTIGGKTKRELLRTISSIFDPLGFLAPVTLAAKILMQEVWRERVDWDEDLPQPTIDKWNHWVKQIHVHLFHASAERTLHEVRNKIVINFK